MTDKQFEKENEQLHSDKSKSDEIKSPSIYGEVIENTDPVKKDVDIVHLKQNEQPLTDNEQDIDDLVHQ